jgi:transposase InsO family protein
VPAVAIEESGTSTNRENDKKDSAYISATCFVSRHTDDWFADSGATGHMTDQRSFFRSFTPILHDTWTVRGIGSSRLYVRGRGSIDFLTTVNGIENTFTIEDILYVPGLGTNLLSVAAVTDVGLSVHFIETRVAISKNQTTLMVGERIGKSLYHLAIHPQLSNNNKTKHSACFAVPSTTSVTLWHQRLAHTSYKTMSKMANNKEVHGLNLPDNKAIPIRQCPGCLAGKMHRLPFPTGRTRAEQTGQLIHADVCGPMHIPTPSGARFFVLFTDDFSKSRHVYFLKHKSEVAEFFKDYTSLLRSETGNLIHTLRSDNGGEFISSAFKTWLSDRSIRFESSAPYTPEQNGVAERANRTIFEAGRSLLYPKHVPLELWGEAIACAVYTLNRVSSSKSSSTPYQLWFGQKPDVSHLRIFGSVAYVHVPKVNRQKLDPKSQKCIFVGYSTYQKAYRCWSPTDRKIKISRDVIFDEQVNDNYLSPSEPTNPFLFFEQSLMQPPTLTPQIERETPNLNPGVQFEPSPSAEPPAPGVQSDSSDTQTPVPDASTATNNRPESIAPSASTPSTTTQPAANVPVRVSPYPLRTRTPTHRWESMQSTITEELYEPESFTDAMHSADAAQWEAAIKDEYDSLMLNKTWSISDLPPGRTAIKSRWVFKIKPGVRGSNPRYKARLVAKGFSQRYGIDYEETFSPVVKYDTLRIILSFVAALDLEMSQLDIKTAFLYGELDEEIYLQQPEGFVISGQESSVCRLHKCLYGLKQASRVWNATFDTFLRKFGLRPSDADPCLYLRHHKEEFVSVAIWVDDGLVASNNSSLIEEIISYLGKHFDMRHGPANHFVGLSISRNRKKRTLYVAQPDYIRKILKRFDAMECLPKSLPADPGTRLLKKIDKSPTEKFPYREAVGSLMYLGLASRPDISFAVGQISQFCEDPGQSHWSAVRRILAYLKGTLNHGIRYAQGADGLLGYCDSDYAGDPNSRRSTSGFVFLLHGGPVAWSSRRQTSVSLSTTEAEFIASSEAAREGVWLSRLMKSIKPGFGEPIRIMCDNQSAIALIKNPVHHQRSKHIEVRYYFVRERQEAGDIDIQYIPTDQQLADCLTKPLPNPRFSILREMMGVTTVPFDLI